MINNTKTHMVLEFLHFSFVSGKDKFDCIKVAVHITQWQQATLTKINI